MLIGKTCRESESGLAGERGDDRGRGFSKDRQETATEPRWRDEYGPIMAGGPQYFPFSPEQCLGDALDCLEVN